MIVHACNHSTQDSKAGFKQIQGQPVSKQTTTTKMPGAVVTPVILTTQEVEIRRIAIQVQTVQKVHKTPSQSIKTGHGTVHLSSQLCGEA
jgi:hypothetical protein